MIKAPTRWYCVLPNRLPFRLFAEEDFFLEFNRHCICDSPEHNWNILKIVRSRWESKYQISNIFLEIGKLCKCLINRKYSENICTCDLNDSWRS